MSAWALIMAAGQGKRMGLPGNKVFMPLGGRTVLERSVRAFEAIEDIQGIVVVARAEECAQVERLLQGIQKLRGVVPGGTERQESVRCGLAHLPDSCSIVLIHDGARAFVDAAIIHRCLDTAREKGSAVACVPVKDTIKQLGQAGALTTLDRDKLVAVQTPQAFRLKEIQEAHSRAAAQGLQATDDAALMENMGYPVTLVEGGDSNIKLTTEADRRLALAMVGEKEREPMIRIGQGFDAHQLVEGRALILCGVRIPYEKGLLGHSDADVAAHALMDALLGALALGDIGKLFPDTEAAYKDCDSMVLLERVREQVENQGYGIGNVDVTLVAQKPKLLPYQQEMRRNMAQRLRLEENQVSLKATTTEGMGWTGSGQGIGAMAVACLMKK